MKNFRSKSKVSIVALVLMLTVAAALVALPAAVAQPRKKTYTYIGAVPNPVGVGQEVLLHVGMTDQLMTAADGWEDLTVTVTDPEGGTQTLGPFTTDSTGGTGTIFVPTEVGNYTLQTHFPEQVYNNIVYLASDSPELELVVQQDPIEYHPSSPLPTEYWTRPIDAQHREWEAISGSWQIPSALFGPSITPAWLAPYNDGPETAHILWTKPLTIGGLVGGDTGQHAFECGDAYEGKWSGSIILAGRLYYQVGGSRGLTPVVTHCVDLHTGEELWSKIFLDNRSISFGQLYFWDMQNQHGVFAYLYVSAGGNYYAFDAYTGDWRFTIENVPSGATLRGPNGEIYILQVNQGQGWMALWNASALCLSQAVGYSGGSWGNSVHMKTFDAAANTTEAKSAWSWNVTIPAGLPGPVRAQFLNDRIVGAHTTRTEVIMWGLSLKSGQEGTLLFNRTWAAPAEWAAGNLTFPGMSGGWVAFSSEDKVGILGIKETCEYYGFSLETGEFLWGPTEPQIYLDQFFGDGRWIAYGRYYSVGVGGVVYCYNVTTGERLWTYEASDPYSEILWSNNWWLEPMFTTDGKIYIGHAEHSPIDPKPRGAPFICLDAETGEEVWRADGLFRQTHWGGLAIIGDSIIAGMNTYDQRVYALGKGPSATTVTAPDIGVPLGSSVVIRGMVTDVSPGTRDYALTARFPNGVPAVADEDMSEWMKYVYQHFAIPADVTGVDVSLDTVDPNGNWIHIGVVTSDMSGTFSHMWTPEIEGKYTIIATFMGSGAYYASYAQTAIGVDPAPEEPVTPAVQEDIDRSADSLMDSLTPILYGTIVAVVVTICLVLYTLWTVRKLRK